MARHPVNGNSLSVTTDSSIPIQIQRAIRRVEDHVSRLHTASAEQGKELAGKVSFSDSDLFTMAAHMRQHLQATGSHPLTIASLPGVAGEAQQGSGGGSGGSGTGVVIRETPSGVMNGTNTTFTLSQAPTPASSLLLFLDGVEQEPGTDYTLSGSTITYVVAPSAADWQLAWYVVGSVTGAPVVTIPLVIGFVIGSGTTGTNVGPMLAAPHAGALSKCVVITKASDATTGLTFVIRQNGVAVANPTIAAGTASGSIATSTVSATVAASDVFSIDITSGSSSWQFTAQLE